jgi:hypothetical protein
LAFISLIFFNANIAFSVDQSSNISDVCFFHNITSVAWFMLL